MKYIDCTIDECVDRNRNRKIYVFGAGGNIRFYESSPLKQLKDQVAGILDNGNITALSLFGREIPVHKPEAVKDEENCAVIITTSIHMADMFGQLKQMGLPDSVEVYIYPLMTLRDDHLLTEEEKRILFSESGKQRIPKVIHSFWFSGTEKPKEYTDCIDSWKRYCPDYEIREYNADNYDTEKHPFLKKAVETGAWAYATDYARLDVLSREGGIYLDMDVEILKPVDFLLKHKGVFSFFSDGGIDLAAFMAAPDNPIPARLLKLYDNVRIPETKKGFEAFFQPLYVLRELERCGVDMNGSFQEVDGTLFLPRYLMMPLDVAVYEQNDNEDTFMVHHANAGWKEESYGESKARRNRAFCRELAEKEHTTT